MIDSPNTELNTLLILQILMRAQSLEPHIGWLPNIGQC